MKETCLVLPVTKYKISDELGLIHTLPVYFFLCHVYVGVEIPFQKRKISAYSIYTVLKCVTILENSGCKIYNDLLCVYIKANV